MTKVKAIDEWKPHIMVSDIAMPGEDGYSLIHTVRDKEALEGGFLPCGATKRARMQIE